MNRDGIDHAFTSATDRGVWQEPTYSGALSFMRRRYTKDLTDVDVAATGIPLDTATTNRPGARFGPRAIREATPLLSWTRPYGWDFDPLEVLSIVDYGDCVWDHGRLETMPDTVTAHIGKILEAGTAPLSMGGDHFITYPILRALHAQHGPIALIHFDAHSDTWDDSDGDGRVDHGTMFYHAHKDGLVDSACSAQVGIRTHNDDDWGFTILDAPWVHRNGIEETVSRIRETVGDCKAYLTFDIDCLDPCFAPGTGTPVSGGLSTAEAIEILKGLRGVNFVGMDIVEVAPAYDVGNITGLAAATLAYHWLGLYASRPGGPAAV